ncbi:hypothetical protein AOLI_G00172160 [Acnodon oligacanthus]
MWFLCELNWGCVRVVGESFVQRIEKNYTHSQAADVPRPFLPSSCLPPPSSRNQPPFSLDLLLPVASETSRSHRLRTVQAGPEHSPAERKPESRTCVPFTEPRCGCVCARTPAD